MSSAAAMMNTTDSANTGTAATAQEGPPQGKPPDPEVAQADPTHGPAAGAALAGTPRSRALWDTTLHRTLSRGRLGLGCPSVWVTAATASRQWGGWLMERVAPQ
jgi:hypothetical protein